ncbi:MAG: endonuclease/exonuclease/phosphatase family protein [Flavobacteriaceae bacterium]|nr:endonuclease/exonuclease/phosphatase family protein [Flavobacteriaceae bacterium]
MRQVFIVIFCVFGLFSNAQMKRTAAVGFYNVENLWDTVKSVDYIDATLPAHHINFHRSVPLDSLKYLEITKDYKGPWDYERIKGQKVVRKQVLSEDFTPKSNKNYTYNIYQQKLKNIAQVISEIGFKYTKTAPAVVGLVEVENRQVVEALTQQDALKKYDYGVVHYNSFDARGIDVALIYQKKRFTVTNSYKKELVLFREDGKREYTRDLLVVSGILDGEKVAFFVNHWPSRRGGEAVSMPKRNAAAALLKQEMDALREKNPNIKLIAMGDFNDDPISPSFKNHLKAVGDEKELNEEYPYFNPMYKMYKKGVASLAYRDAPNLFDQIIYSKNLVSNYSSSSEEYTVYRTEVYAPAYLINKQGNYKGYPFRSWDGDKFTGGYSDHFPVFTILQKEAK